MRDDLYLHFTFYMAYSPKFDAFQIVHHNINYTT